jgi:pimeloyl-ACP methyl ester carboxylesterase
MFENFTRTEIKTSGARIVTVHGGKGPPLLLMHGNPFSHLSWHKFAPRLAQEFTVVATDLRGYGDSEKPPGSADHANYSFRAMAQDQIEVMAALGHERFYAAGHDRGARVLHRMCLDHPDKVVRAAILDIIPQHHLLNNVTRAWGTFSWHWFFMIQPYDFPERLMSADPDYFIEKKLAKTLGLKLLRSARACGIQALFPQSRDCACDVRRLSRHPRRRSRHGHRGFRGGAKNNLPGAAAMGRHRRRWPQPRCRTNLTPLRQRHSRRQGAALRALPLRRGAGGDVPGAASVFYRRGTWLGRVLVDAALPFRRNSGHRDWTASRAVVIRSGHRFMR